MARLYKKHSNNYSYYTPVKRQAPTSIPRKKIIKPKKKRSFGANLRFLIFCTIFFSLIFPSVFNKIAGELFFNKINTQNVYIPKTLRLLNKTESILTNYTFLNKTQLPILNTKTPCTHIPFYAGEMTGLNKKLEKLATKYNKVNPGIFVLDYKTGRYADINANKAIPTASIIKLPILIEILKKYDKGELSLKDTITLEKHHVSSGSGKLQYKFPGAKFTIEELARKMIQESDNTATNMLLEEVGGYNAMNKALRNWGITGIKMQNWLPDLKGSNKATPKDLGRLLYNLDQEDFLSFQSRSILFDILGNVKNRYLIQAGLPLSANFFHKTGDIGTMLGDAGLVELPSGRRYIIVIMAERSWNSYQAKKFIIEATRITHNHIVATSY